MTFPIRSQSRRRGISRRHALGGLAAIVLLPFRAAAQPTLAPTPAQTEGPFYPRSLPADRDADLTQVVGRAGRAQGVILYLSGRVLTREGQPRPGTTIELWQCDARGRYHHVGDMREPRDDNFQGYGTTTTDAAGRYAFKTIRPVAYPGRPPHLHVKVHPADTAALTTQIYIKGDIAGGDAVLRSSPEGTLERLSMVLAPALGRESGALAGTFDFVV
jgi:protocatechuate 3,4-dioxygenase beta subunit